MPEDKMKRYLFEYRYDDAEWGLEIWAHDENEAMDRLKALPWARLQGEVSMSVRIPRTPLIGLLGRIRTCMQRLAQAIGVAE